METGFEVWRPAARRLLQRLRRPSLLESDRDGIAVRDAMATPTVYEAVRLCAERAVANGDRRLRTIVERCDVAGETVKVLAGDLHLSMRQLFRFRAAIVDALAAEMARAVESRVAVPRDPARAEAWRLLARAELLLARMAPGDAQRAIAAAERALRADASLTGAWCVIASANMSLALGSALDARLAYARAGTALDRAASLSPRSGAVAGLRASLCLWTTRDDRAAAALAEHALETASGTARGHYTLAWIAVLRGDFDEAERHIAAAVLAAPAVGPYHLVAMAVLHLRGAYARCAERCRELHETDPEDAYVLGYYTETLNALGDHAGAVAVAAAAPPAARNFSVDAAVARARALLGDRDGARSIAAGFHGPAVSAAAIALALGDEDRAWRALERAREEPNGMLELTAYDRAFEPIWDEPRFRRLVS